LVSNIQGRTQDEGVEEEADVDWKNFHNEKFYDWQTLPDIAWVIK
jgi:hypothetical protein